jgi:hypothetical protein
MLPAKLKNFAVFNDGQSYMGTCAEAALPKLASLVEAYRGAGMLAEVDYDLGLEKLEMEETYGGLVVGVLRQFGQVDVAGAMTRYIGAYQSADGSRPVAAELLVRGKLVEIDPGTAKAGEDTQWKGKRTLAYLRWTINGVVEVEIDVINGVFMIGGVDRMAEIMAILNG